ncbi:unnamed protein product [Nesidiocoris tenuis]|uniref:Uncharacterized protein n=1 Tax=Nesidiocoris tenuis TaxID=355587 RepID=A0A6H5HM61_9HEMI|nr:unnamed protein product [Nesidiocoris tenuis]
MLSAMMTVLYLTSLQSISAKEYRQDVVSTLFGNVWKSARSKVLGEAATDDISTVPSTQDEKNMIPLESTEFRKFSTPDSSAIISTNFELKEGVDNSSQPPQFPNDNNSNNSIFSNPTGTESGIVESTEIYCGIENCTTLATPEAPDTRVVDWGVLLDPLKSINPSQLTNLLDQVKEGLADILAGERLGGNTKDSIVDYFDSFSRNVIGFAKETYEILKNETAQLETQEMESMLDNFRQKFDYEYE